MNDELILAFVGSETTAGILKGVLEFEQIGSIVKNESEAARLSGFGSTGRCEVFISETNVDKAKPIIEEFSKRNP